MEVTSHALATSQSLNLDPAIGPPSPAPPWAREQFVDAGKPIKKTGPKPGDSRVKAEFGQEAKLDMPESTLPAGLAWGRSLQV
jgi:hypothetical protein